MRKLLRMLKKQTRLISGMEWVPRKVKKIGGLRALEGKHVKIIADGK